MRSVAIRVADAHDVDALAELRMVWSDNRTTDDTFRHQMSAWLAAEGDRRTTWLAMLSGTPVGMASVFEYRRMPRPRGPVSRWGYVSNMFVREEIRNRGIGSALLSTVIAVADRRGYVRLVLSPSAESLRFYERAGFVWPHESAGGDHLLVRRTQGAGPGTSQ